MKLNPAKLNQEIREAIVEHYGWNDGFSKEEQDKRIALLSVEEAFEKFLHWNGIINYTSTIVNALDNIRAAMEPESYLEGWSEVIEKMHKQSAERQAQMDQPVEELLTLIQADPGVFGFMLRAMIKYVSEGENADDALNVKWAMIAIQLRAVQQATEYTL